MKTLVVDDLGATDLDSREMADLNGGVGPLAKIGIRLAVKAYIEAYDNPISVDNLLKMGEEQLTSSKQ